ncbi:MAG: iron-sulfur cluster insertion protein ErpA [Deltaproteobacteria bacterium]|nr:iron-sulfur cluster insertion protein ErpA [Deltaproteobacteria bacterium]
MTSVATPTSFTPAPFEDVLDFPVSLSPKAVEMVKEAMAAEKLEGWGLRVFVQGGGCGGFQYGLDFDEAPRAGDLETTVGGVKVFVDPMSAMHLEGTNIDYVMGVSGSGFKFNNPNAKTTCGCGSSFSA